MKRKYNSSILITTITVGNNLVTVYETSDLSNTQLQEHYTRAIEKQDFEYCQALVAEADSRNIKLAHK